MKTKTTPSISVPCYQHLNKFVGDAKIPRSEGISRMTMRTLTKLGLLRCEKYDVWSITTKGRHALADIKNTAQPFSAFDIGDRFLLPNKVAIYMKIEPQDSNTNLYVNLTTGSTHTAPPDNHNPGVFGIPLRS